MRSKHLILILLVPLSEMKALFYNSDIRVYYSFFSQEKKYLCNVVEMYSNLLIFSILFFLFAFLKQDLISRKICLFLFVINLLDLIHFGFMDVPYFVIPKLCISYIIFRLWLKLKMPHSNF